MHRLARLVLLAGVVGALLFGIWLALAGERPDPVPAPEPGPPAQAPVLVRGAGLVRDELVVWATEAEFAAGEGQRVSITAGGASGRIELADGRADAFPRTGTWTSPVVEPGLAFIELLPSWNVSTPPQTGIRVDGRVRIDGQWSPWLDFGYWGRVPPPETSEDFEYGEVAVDILELERSAQAWQLRAAFFDFRVGASAQQPALLRLAAVASGPADEPQAATQLAWSGDHAVPFIAQRSAGEQIGGDICSPTCVSMVAAFHGAQRPLIENALAIYDAEHDIFGNWNRAVARAGELGLAAQVERFDDLDQARIRLRDGLPLIISVRYKAGEAPSFLMQKTSGHLIVLRGVTPEGDFIVNDPADAEKGEGAIYKAADVRKAWLENAAGVAYVLAPRQDREQD